IYKTLTLCFCMKILLFVVVAANSVACRGLDHLEEKVSALQYSPAEVISDIYTKELMSSILEATKDSVTSPIKQTSNFVLDKVSAGYQQSKNALSDSIHYVINSKFVCLAKQRADRSDGEPEDDGSMEEQEPNVGASGPKPSLSWLGAVFGTICRRAFEKTAAQFQCSKRQGQGLVTQIPGVSPLVSSKRHEKCWIACLLNLPNTYFFLQSNVLPRLVSGLGQQLLKVYGSVMANKKVMKQIPMQQKAVLGCNNKKVPNHRSPRKSLTDYIQISSSSSSSYTRTVQNSRNAAPTTE
uniref:Uncharacterized protein n=1 Tax=Cyprinus carpio TaxID=7962 RepID=A0A8C2C5T6_CYPCA